MTDYLGSVTFWEEYLVARWNLCPSCDVCDRVRQGALEW